MQDVKAIKGFGWGSSTILPYGAYTYSRSFESLGDITIIRIYDQGEPADEPVEFEK